MTVPSTKTRAYWFTLPQRDKEDSRGMALQNENTENERIAGDRRDDRRYQIALDLRWKLIRRRKVLNTGEGSTVDLSSGGILFDSRRSLPVGLDVELSITWPILLNNNAPMQLVVSGRIVRSSGTAVAIRMVQHEFRTIAAAGEPRRAALPERLPTMLMGGRGTGTYDVFH